MKLTTERLMITEFEKDMAECVHLNSLDEDTRRFVPDEVFETVEEALETIEYLMTRYEKMKSPLVYPMILNTGENIGYVQMVKLSDGWEIGYHVAKPFTSKGYATESVKAFLPVMMESLGLKEVHGVCDADNIASRRVMEKVGFKKTFEGIGRYHGKNIKICHYMFR